ncbi:MAG: MbnH family di-heme enzyme [Cyanobacteria bacterium J06631_9]
MLIDRLSSKKLRLRKALSQLRSTLRNHLSFRWLNWVLIGTLVFSSSIGLDRAMGAEPVADDFQWNLPGWVPKPVVPEDNPMNAAKVELGRRLFYDSRLSATGDFSCATCHIQALAFTDGEKVSVGATGQVHPRNSMSLTNAGYNSVQTWANPLMQHLEQQMLVPLFGEEPVELGMAGKEAELIKNLQNDANYQVLFNESFPEQASVSVRNISRAIAAFERTIVSFNSPYDSYRYGGDSTAISESAKRGEALFTSERMECFHCHSGLNFSDSARHERSGFVEIAFHNTGLYNIDGKGAYPPNNTGVEEITLEASDVGRFRAPTLRNIAVTAPYMHDGSIDTLSEAIDHYAAGGRTITEGPNAGIGSENPLKSSFIKGFEISESERQDLIAFLESLTDEQFLTNSALSDPNFGDEPQSNKSRSAESRSARSNALGKCQQCKYDKKPAA